MAVCPELGAVIHRRKEGWVGDVVDRRCYLDTIDAARLGLESDP